MHGLLAPIAALLIAATAPPLTPDEFKERYGVLDGPAGDECAPVPAEVPRIFDEHAAGARFGASVTAIRTLFRERAKAARPAVTDPVVIRQAIDTTFGVSKLGEGHAIVRSEPMSGDLTYVQFTFGDGGLGEAVVGVPKVANGILLVALHGCGSSPDAVMTPARSYVHSFGLRAMQRGFTVVAPALVSQCGWIHNLDLAGSLTGVSVFGYELAKIREITRWARQAYAPKHTALWGISLGGQYAMLASALNPGLYDVTVVSAAATGYEEGYLQAFDSTGLDASKPMGANTQFALSAHFPRADIAAAIVPRHLVFEIGTKDLTPGAIGFIERADEIARGRGAPRPRVVLFEGEHETHPEGTAGVIERIFGAGRVTR